ncbi:MAG: hypothetical protein O7J95_01525 [Planctomycetota bacterium]|nr:hypothetical protein [Planctomycetota bacterium]
MNDAVEQRGPSQLPAGFAAIPISRDQASAPLQICVAVKLDPDAAAGHLVVLRETLDARVFLGSISDAGGGVLCWIEIWIQNTDHAAAAPTTARRSLSNASIDRRWGEDFDALRELDGELVTETGWERAHPEPTFLDLETRQPVHLTDASSGERWRLCQDDALLASKGLSPYSTSLDRYLHLPGRGEDSPLIPVTSGALTSEHTRSLSEVIDLDRVVPLNPAAGLVLVRRFTPLGLEPFLDVLGGQPWDGLLHGRQELDVGAPAALVGGRAAEDAPPDGRLFLGRHGRWGRFVETFHLKLSVLAQVAGTVRSFVRRIQRPLLNLRPASVGLFFGEPSRTLPFLWGTRSVLLDPGDALVLPIESTEESYYLIGRSTGASIYRPASAEETVQGTGTVRIRQLLQESGQTVVEGTLSTQERIPASASGLLWLRLSPAGKSLDIYARVETQATMVAGEWRFRTVGEKMAKPMVEALRSSEGVLLRDTPFEFVSLLSTPCDLYSLGVLCVRALLVNSQRSLPIALDEVLSLARQVAEEYDEEKDLPSRIRQIFDGDEKWAEVLGPQFLSEEDMPAQEAFHLITPELWWDALALMVTTFPGVGPDSSCRDFGDARSGSLHRVFDRVVEDLDRLLLRTRSLVVIDWRFNREIHTVIRGLLSSPEVLDSRAARKASGKK